MCLLLCSSRESRADDHAPARLPLSTSPFLSVYATICTSRNFTASYRPYRIAGVRLHMRNSYQRFGRTCHDTFVSLFCYPDSTPGLTTGVWPDGQRLRPPMPQFRMSREDAESVVAYLRSLTPSPR